MAKELVITGNGAVRWKDTETGKWTAKPVGVMVDAASIKKNLHAIPSALEPEGGPESSATKSGLFQQTVSIKNIRELFTRDELLFASVETLSRDVFAKWFELTALKTDGSINEEATKRAWKIMEKVGLKNKMRIAFRSRIIHGVAVLYLVYPGNIESPVETRRLQDVKVVPWDNISDWVIDLDPNSEGYGNVVGVQMDRVVGRSDGTQETTQQVTIHDGRFLHWPMPDIDGTNPWGMSKLEPLHDILTLKKNMDWSLGESLFQFVSGKIVMTVPPDTDDAVYNQLKKDLKDFDVTTSFLARGKGLDIQNMNQGQAGIDIEPYTSYFMALATIGLGVPYPTFFRGLTGAGGDIIMRTYSSTVGDIQRGEVEPLVRDFLDTLNIEGVARWQIDWVPFMELTEEEQSFIRSRLALARQLTGRATDFFLKNGASVVFNNDGWIERIFNKDAPDGDELILHPPEPQALPTAPQPPGNSPGEPAGGTPTPVPGEPPDPQTPEQMEEMLMRRTEE
ncbi:MAG: anti-CBASS Acb1 family protein [Candidatus Binatia bacterium]